MSLRLRRIPRNYGLSRLVCNLHLIEVYEDPNIHLASSINIPGHWRKRAVETGHFRGIFAFSVKLFESAGLSTIG